MTRVRRWLVILWSSWRLSRGPGGESQSLHPASWTPIVPHPSCHCANCRVVAPLLNALRERMDERHPPDRIGRLAPPYEPDMRPFTGADGKLRPEIRRISEVSLAEAAKARDLHERLQANRTTEVP